MASYKTAEAKKALIADMHTIIWAYTVNTDKKGDIVFCQKPIRGIIGHDSMIGNFFVPLTVDGRYDLSKAVCITDRNYADTKVEAIEGFNALINEQIKRYQESIAAAEALKI